MKIFYPFLIALLWSCNTLETAKDEKLTDSNSKYSDIYSGELATNNNVEDFERFFSRFSKDSTFQKSRIIFPLKVKSDDGEKEETTLMEKEDWKYTDYLNLPYVQLERKQIKEDLINLVYTKEETGVLVYHYFQKIDGKWKLILIEDHST